MEFGDWLRSQRQNRELDIRTLAEISQVDPSTISRIENRHTQSTLYTAYRLCKGLQVTSSELYYGLTDAAMVVRKQVPNDKENAIDLTDMKALLNDFRLNKKQIYHYFAEVLNHISARISLHTDAYPQFTPENMEAFLSGTYHSVFHFVFDYPYDIHSEIILYNYEHGGVLLLDDIGAYTRNMRRSKRETLRNIGDQTEISISVLSRLEDGVLERIKLSDILMLDAALKQSGLLLNMCWDVCFFDEWTDLELRNWAIASKTNRRSTARDSKLSVTRTRQIISHYVKVCRWFQHLQSPDFAWPKYRSVGDEHELLINAPFVK